MVLLVGGILLALGYYLFFAPGNSVLVGNTEPLNTTLLLQTQEFIERRQQLDIVTLDTALFTDPRFTSLRSFETPVAPQAMGKNSVFDGSQAASAPEVAE